MNRFVLGVFAVSAASTLGFAGSKDGEWLGLDREIESLASSLNTTAPAVGVSAFLRTSFFMADQEVLGATADDETGFAVDNARVNFDADVGAGYGLHIALEGGGGNVTLIDGYGTFKLGDMVKGTMGQFRAPFLWSGWLDENQLLFNDRALAGRTLSGAFTALRDQGVMLSGNFDQFGWAVSAQNGLDGTQDELHLSARGSFNAMGTGVGMQEGAYNSPNTPNLTIGIGYTDLGEDVSGTITDTTAIGGDVAFTQGPFYAHGEIADYDTDIGDATPFTLTASWMIQPNQWEVAGRYEDWDDLDDTSRFGLGVIYYANGHNAKWSLEWDDYSSDNAPVDGTAISLSLTVGV